MAVEWLASAQGKRVGVQGVRMASRTMSIGADVLEALDYPERVHIGIDDGARVLVIRRAKPGEGFKLTHYSGSRTAVLTARSVALAVQDRLDWEIGREIGGKVQGSHVVCRLREDDKPSPRRGQLGAAVGGVGSGG